MSNFSSFQRKKRGQSAAPTSSFARPVRPFAPLPSSSSQSVPLSMQGSIERANRSGHSFARIPLFPPEKKNNTSLPDTLKAGVEHLSGLSINDVNVHYNSSQPAQVQALAYTQGTDIHVGPGQERHLPHEAWHVVQQKQGRVKPTLQARGVAINDDQGLEHEADVMGKTVSQIDTGYVQRKEASDADSVENNSSLIPSFAFSPQRQPLEMLGASGSAIIQRQGSYIPDVDGPYGHEYNDGPSTARAQFSGPLKNDIYDLNARRVPPEQTDLVQISDEDDETMLTRERSVVAEVDHIYPRSLGGSSSHRNAAVLSSESNNLGSNNYPKELDNDYDGTRVLMGHGVNANGIIRGHYFQFNVPAYHQYPVYGHGAAALIDMSDYNYNVSQNGAAVANMQGSNNLTPAEARTLGILPNDMPNPI